MEIFEAQIKQDGGGRLTVADIPFDAKDVFHQQKGTLFVYGTINHIAYRCKLLSRGKGRFVVVVDKALQKAAGYNGEAMTAQITMDCNAAVSVQTNGHLLPIVFENLLLELSVKIS